MPIVANLRHLEDNSLKLTGELPVAELELGLRDDLIRAEKPLYYELEVQRLGDELLVQGRMRLPLQCECVRCLKQFELQFRLDRWTQVLPLAGEEKVSIVSDCVDLTPFLREDILLEFPQHPLCETDCRGLPNKSIGAVEPPSDDAQSKEEASAWAALDKLKLKD